MAVAGPRLAFAESELRGHEQSRYLCRLRRVQAALPWPTAARRAIPPPARGLPSPRQRASSSAAGHPSPHRRAILRPRRPSLPMPPLLPPPGALDGGTSTSTAAVARPTLLEA